MTALLTVWAPLPPKRHDIWAFSLYLFFLHLKSSDIMFTKFEFYQLFRTVVLFWRSYENKMNEWKEYGQKTLILSIHMLKDRAFHRKLFSGVD